MAVVYSATLKTNRMQLVADLTAGKTAAASTGSASAGQLVIGTASLSGATVFWSRCHCRPHRSRCPVPWQRCRARRSRWRPRPPARRHWRLRTNAGATVCSGLTVGTSGTDIVLGTTAITSGGTVTITAGTITHG